MLNVKLFHEQGYIVIPALLDQAAVTSARIAYEELLAKATSLEYSTQDFNLESTHGGFYAQDGQIKCYQGILRSVFNVEQHSSYFANLPQQLDFKNTILNKLLGAYEAELLSSILWCKPPVVGSAQPWHQDFGYTNHASLLKFVGGLTIWIALDPATADNGYLEFITGSHKWGLVHHYGSSDPSFGDQLHLKPSEVFPDMTVQGIELNPGDAVCFDALVAHSSKDNRSKLSRSGISYGYVALHN
jgi:ectoine hydroxylase-related dioxygenase (phytanoyl-CoA dioxygenase family)